MTMTRGSFLSVLLGGLMAAQATLGLVFAEHYRDVEWIKATWFGNDWVTLALAVPLLLVGVSLARRGSTRGLLLWLGALGYAVYNYAFYLFGAALNVFFLLYVGCFTLALVALVLALSATRPEAIASQFQSKPRARAVGGYLVFVALGLSAVWVGVWAAYAFAGRPTPVEPEAFKLVAALDLTLMVPALAFGGILLWRQRPWGLVIAAIAGVQGTLYLLVLSMNSVVAVYRGLVEAPGQTPVWGSLAVGTFVATTLLLAGLRDAAPGTASTQNPHGA